MPSALATTNKKGVPVVSILVAAVIGSLAFGPFKSWNALVNVVTGATAIMYAFAPVSLAALHKVDGGRPRSYRVPMPALAAAGGVLLGEPDHLLGRLRHDVEARRAPCWSASCCSRSARVRAGTGAQRTLRNAIWIAPWLGGHVRHRRARPLRRRQRNILPNWVDLAVVIVFSLAIFYWAVVAEPEQGSRGREVAKDAHQLAFEAGQE